MVAAEVFDEDEHIARKLEVHAEPGRRGDRSKVVLDEGATVDLPGVDARLAVRDLPP